MKKLLICLLIVAMLTTLIGCTSADPTTTAATQPTGADVTDPTTQPTEPTETTKPKPTLPAGTAPQPTQPSSTAATTATTTATTMPQIQGYLAVGDTMPDFTITDIYGESYTLYQLLAEKQVVMLNFWFMECGYCKLEFPHINEAYNQYQDLVEILAVNPYDSVAGMKSFRYTYGLNFTVTQDPIGLARAFMVGAYPTTVIIDRYGVVCVREAGAYPDTQLFLNVFAYFTAEDYETTLFNTLDEIPG